MCDLGHLGVVGGGSEPEDEGDLAGEWEDDEDGGHASVHQGTKKDGEKALPGFKKEMSSSEDKGTPFGEF